MNGTILLLLLIIGCFGIAATGCLLWADDLEGIAAEIGRLVEDTIKCEGRKK